MATSGFRKSEQENKMRGCPSEVISSCRTIFLQLSLNLRLTRFRMPRDDNKRDANFNENFQHRRFKGS
ncbi:unnamed protein product [Caenorhabditis nigoni]